MTVDSSSDVSAKELAQWRFLMQELSALGQQLAAAREARNTRMIAALQSQFDAIAFKADLELARAVAAVRRPGRKLS